MKLWSYDEHKVTLSETENRNNKLYIPKKYKQIKLDIGHINPITGKKMIFEIGNRSVFLVDQHVIDDERYFAIITEDSFTILNTEQNYHRVISSSDFYD